MLDILLEKTILNQKDITNFFNTIGENIDIDKIQKEFHEYNPKTETPTKTFAAIDGSYNNKKLMAAFVYAIASQTIIYNPKTKITKESSAGDIKLISSTKTRNIREILSQQMNILELKSTIDTLQRYPDIDYMLLDGMISGIIYQTSNSKFSPLIKKYLQQWAKQIEIEIYSGNFPIEVKSITQQDEIIEKIKQIYKFKLKEEVEDLNSIISYMQTLEQLTCLNYLLKKFSHKIVGISKTSSTQQQFNQQIPDAAAVEYTCENPGYTTPMKLTDIRPLRTTSDDSIHVQLPIHKDLTNIVYTTFFTRLDKRGNVLKIELPYDISEDEDKIKSILDDINSISLNGYPYILKRAHDDVVIKQEDMYKIMKRLGIYEKTGRDMLEK